MEPRTLRQIRGAKELVEETVDAATLAINEVQRTMTRMPYALLARIGPIAVPVKAIEQAHLKIADSVYLTIIYHATTGQPESGRRISPHLQTSYT